MRCKLSTPKQFLIRAMEHQQRVVKPLVPSDFGTFTGTGSTASFRCFSTVSDIKNAISLLRKLAVPKDVVDTPTGPVFRPHSDGHRDKRVAPTGLNAKSNSGTNVGIIPVATFKKQPLPCSEESLGACSAIFQQLSEMVEWPLLHGNLFANLGVEPPTGLLVTGPSGIGKTTVVNAFVHKLNADPATGRYMDRVSFFPVNANSIIQSKTGETEELIRRIFDEAREAAPSIIFFDNIEILSTKSEFTHREMEKRIVAQLCCSMDDLAMSQSAGAGGIDKDAHGLMSYNRVFVIGATSKLSSIDTALRRANRFEREVELSTPTRVERLEIIKKIVQYMKIEAAFDAEEIAHVTPGYVGADIKALAREAAMIALRRYLHSSSVDDASSLSDTPSNVQNSPQAPCPGSALGNMLDLVQRFSKVCITTKDFLQARHNVKPTSLQEGFVTVPDVSMEDIGALDSLKRELDLFLLQPLTNPEKFKNLGLKRFGGLIMFSTPGQGKTLICKALSAKAEVNFIAVKGPELMNMYVGESERAIRATFARARSSAPCILFLDEFDSIGKARGAGSFGGSDVNDKVVNCLLTEMDGLQGGDQSERQNQVFVIAATNRIDLIDKGLLRPGRFDKILYIPMPSMQERCDILFTCIVRSRARLEDELSANLAPPPATPEQRRATNLYWFLRDNVAPITENFTGADLAGLVREAGMCVIREGGNDEFICRRHIIAAATAAKRSVSDEDLLYYEKTACQISGGRWDDRGVLKR